MKKVVWLFVAVGLFVIGFVILIGQKDVSPRTDPVSVNQDNEQRGAMGTEQIDTNPDPAIQAGKQLSNNSCEGDAKPKLSVLPMKYEDFAFIIPYGMTAGGHVTPIDHQYFPPTVFRSPRDTYEVRAMADARLVDIGERTTDKGTEYRLIFAMSCKLFYYYDLVTSLTPELKQAYVQRRVNIPIKAGQVIGRIGGQTLDFAVWDMDMRLTGFVVPEHYDAEMWKIHTVDPLIYYTEDLKKEALSKYIRTAEPVSGKIDYDIDGMLVGNWFVEGSGGYIPQDKQGGGEYWKGHLSLAYDHYDPTSIVVSIGDYGGEAMQFGVRGNAPDPATVDVAIPLNDDAISALSYILDKVRQAILQGRAQTQPISKE